MNERRLRVVQLNAASLLEPHWDERRHEIVAWIRQLQPDIVCLEEVWQDDRHGNTAGWIVEHTPDLPFHWVFGGAAFGEHFWGDPSLHIGSAVLSRWPIDDHTYHRLPIAPDEDPVVSGIPWELLHVRTVGLDVFACHLAPAPTHGLHRQLQVIEIDRIIRDARGELDDMPPFPGKRDGMPPILCGDLNAEPDSDEIRFLCGLTPLDGRTTYYQDAWRVAGDGPGMTQGWRGNPIAAAMNVPRKRIDYVFVGDPFQRRDGAGRVLAAELACHTPLTGVLASDHTGLVVDIEWPDRPS